MSENLIKRLRTVARDEERAWGDEDEVVILLREAADALSRPAPVQVSSTSLGVPSGWKLVRDGDAIIVSKFGIGGCVVRRDATEAREIPETILWELARDMLAAAPSAPAAPAVDTQRIMGLVENYGDAMFAAGISCAHHEHRNERDYRDDADEAKAQIRAMLTPANVAHGWIPVGERRPGVGVAVLGFWKNSAGPHSHITGQNYGITARSEHGLWYDASEDDNEDDEWMHPDYWQPLPPPPAIANQEAQDGR